MTGNLNFLSINNGIKLRKEYFGGIVFDTNKGTMIDLDIEAFNMLEIIQNNSLISKDSLIGYLQTLSKKKARYGELAAKVIEELIQNGILVEHQSMNDSETKNAVTQIVHLPQMDKSIIFHLNAPETVHWAVTFRCEQQCPDCYADRHNNKFTELNTKDALRVVDILAQSNVFQLAIGGGEPLLRQDLPEIIQRAHQKGIVVHITTGCEHLDYKTMNKLAKSITCLQIGIKHDRLLLKTEAEVERLTQFVNIAKKLGIHIGANLMLSKSSLENFEYIVEQLNRCGFKRITLLRYKPPNDISRWVKENPSKEDFHDFEMLLPKLINRFSDLELRVDCALSFLQRRLPINEATYSGIRGCVAGSRILSLAPDGSIFPCSQLINPKFCAGNILRDNFYELWIQSKVIRKYRAYREKRVFKESLCGICKARYQCGGCRVFADDALGGDIGCLEPLLEPLHHLGKNGRAVDFKEYCKNNSGISVGKYMERYEVGQKRAISELKNCSWVSTPKSDSGKKIGYYQSTWIDTLTDIQESIGFTEGGAPYATFEEIEEWIKEEDYPKWIL